MSVQKSASKIIDQKVRIYQKFNVGIFSHLKIKNLQVLIFSELQ